MLDGTFVREPLYGALVAALRPDRRVLVNLDHYGVATGAALLAGHETRPAPGAAGLGASGAACISHTFRAYRDRWRSETLSRRQQ